jgi:lysophospholipase L1-like esterase
MPDIPSKMFPQKTALAIVAVAVLMAALPYLPGKKVARLQPQQFAAMLHLRRGFLGALSGETEVAQGAAQPQAGAQVKAPSRSPEPLRPRSYLDIPPGSLTTFLGALLRAEQRQPGAIVRVLHYGDSPTSQDYITADVRALLGRRFGDAGHGFVLIAKPWAWYSHRGVELDAQGWLIDAASSNLTREKDGIHGLGGVSFRGGAGAYSRVRLPDDKHTMATVYYLAQPNGGKFRVHAAGQMLAEIDTDADLKHPGFAEVGLRPGTHEVELTVASGTVRLFGYRFDKDGPGIQYSSLGINGARVQMVVAFFELSQWTSALRHENPDLVIVNYGTNESIFPDYIDGEYSGELRKVISRLRQALPDASILIMSPMDRGVKGPDGAISTPAALPRLIEVQRQVAAETGCAFFNTYEAMGGEGTMARWYSVTPRLVSADYMHPMPAGAAKVGALFEQALIGAYESATGRPRETNRPSSSQPAPKPAPAPVEATPSR